MSRANKIVYVYNGDNVEDDKYFEECDRIEEEIFKKFDKYLYVKLYVDSDDGELIKKYDELIESHNRKIERNIGLSLISPIELKTEENVYDYTLWFDVKCVCQLVMSNNYMYEDMDINLDNKIYKLQPIQGIKSLKGVYRSIMPYDIDYIGNLKANLKVSREYELDTEYTLIKKYAYVYDLINNEMDPIYVERVKTIDELYTTKIRM